jgi:hypothetical protein
MLKTSQKITYFEKGYKIFLQNLYSINRNFYVLIETNSEIEINYTMNWFDLQQKKNLIFRLKARSKIL